MPPETTYRLRQGRMHLGYDNCFNSYIIQIH